MKHTILIFSFLLVCFCTNAQITISGTVRDIVTRKPAADANVILQNKTATAIYSYTTTDDEGKFLISCNVKTDSLLILITGFNVRETRLVVSAKTQTINIDIVGEALKIKEVKVTADPIVRRSDTIDYYVSSFTDQSDRTIGDVLKKMPGIDVAVNGEIKYNGKPINKFYIENLDMLEGRYGIATNNVQAKDIATVQVYENHQSKKVLQNVEFSDNAALNLKLKESAKGTFNTVLQLGGGYKPAMWSAEIVSMYFARKFQTLNTYKTNNSGNDVAQEFISHYEDSGSDYYIAQTQIQKPTTPNITQSRYLKNNIHAVSFNSIRRVSENIDIKANAVYIHDKQKSFGNSLTTHFLPSATLYIPEDIYARSATDKLEASAEYLANTKTSFIKNKLQVNGMWNKDFGTVQTNSDYITQNFKNPQINIVNDFVLIKVYNNIQMSFSSLNSYGKSTARLSVAPLLYPDIFVNNSSFTGSGQDVNASNFKSRTTAFTSRKAGKFDFGLLGGYDLQIEKMTSALSPFDNTQTNYSSADSLHNNILWNQFKLFVSPHIQYSPNSLFHINISAPVSFLNQYSKDKIIDNKNKRNKIFVEPALQIYYKLNIHTSISAGAAITSYNGTLYDTYNGYIMNNYRSIGNNLGLLNDALYQNYNISLSYGNAIRSLFGSLSAVYYKNTNSLMQNINYAGMLSQITSYEIDNSYDGYILSGKMSKRYDNISSTFGLFCTYRKGFSDLLRQDILMKYINDYVNIGASANIRFSKKVVFDYNISWGQSSVKIKNGQDDFLPVKNLNQNAALSLFITKMLTLSVLGEHFYNSAITNGSRTMFFADAYITYKTKRMEYIFEASNLTNQRYYKSASYSDISNYIYSYDLRPISFLFKVRFSLR